MSTAATGSAPRVRAWPDLADLTHLVIGQMLRIWMRVGFRVTVRHAVPLQRGGVLGLVHRHVARCEYTSKNLCSHFDARSIPSP